MVSSFVLVLRFVSEGRTNRVDQSSPGSSVFRSDCIPPVRGAGLSSDVALHLAHHQLDAQT